MRIPGAGDRRLYAFCSDNDPELPLSFQSGDVLAVRIRKLNPHNDSDLYWDGEVVDRTSFTGLTDVCAIITCPYDHHDDDWQAPNLSPLGVIPSFGACSDAKAAMKALNKAAVSFVDIHHELNPKQFNRQMNDLDALQQQFAWEKVNDPNGRSCTADLLFCNRFDHLPLVDLYEGVDEAAVDAIKHSLSDGQRQALSLCRKMRGGVAIVQGPPGTGKSFLLRTLLEPFYSTNTATHSAIVMEEPAVVADEPTAVVDEPRIAAADMDANSIAAFRDKLKDAADNVTAVNLAVILDQLKNTADGIVPQKNAADKITSGLSAVTMEEPENAADNINTDPSAVAMEQLNTATVRGRKILIVSPINKNVDDLSNRVRETLTKHKPDVMVIRVYSEGTEKAIINRNFSGRAVSKFPIIDADEALAETGVMSEATKMMYNEYNAATTKPIQGVNDKRVTLTELEHSLGMNMSRLAGIIPTHGVPPPEKYSELRTLFSRSRQMIRTFNKQCRIG
ncbi:hypothetical protein BDV97DRAFT_165828 [Delphinella strobiligena]|nr:hypothetical protein BDV97DRAFT_165828 [Delphinella strobiligena]